MIEIETISTNTPYRSDIPVLPRRQIELLTEEILAKTMPDALTAQEPVDVEYLIEDPFELRLDYCTLDPDGTILGETIFRDGIREIFDYDTLRSQPVQFMPGTIILDEMMCDVMETRLKFTAAHELGHWIMHQKFYGKTENRACRSHLRQRTHFPHYQAKSPIEWTEWQANAFASALLLPRPALRITLREFLAKHNLTWRQLCDFSDYRNRITYVELLDTIAYTYDVSRDTARLRMNKLCNIRFPN